MDRLDGRALAVAVLGICLGVAACQSPTAPGPINVINNNTATNTVGASPSPSPGASGCNPVGSVGIHAPGSVRVGETTRLDATPRDQSGNIRSDACNVASGVSWIVAPASVCSINDPGSFIPTLRGLAVGTCSVVVSVGSASRAVTVEVLP